MPVETRPATEAEALAALSGHCELPLYFAMRGLMAHFPQVPPDKFLVAFATATSKILGEWSKSNDLVASIKCRQKIIEVFEKGIRTNPSTSAFTQAVDPQIGGPTK